MPFSPMGWDRRAGTEIAVSAYFAGAPFELFEPLDPLDPLELFELFEPFELCHAPWY